MRMVLVLRSDKRILKKTIKLIAKFTDYKKSNITTETKLKDELGLTSFDFVTIIVEFEDVFSIEIDGWDELSSIVTIQDIVDLVTRYIKIKRN